MQLGEVGFNRLLIVVLLLGYVFVGFAFYEISSARSALPADAKPSLDLNQDGQVDGSD